MPIIRTPDAMMDDKMNPPMPTILDSVNVEREYQWDAGSAMPVIACVTITIRGKMQAFKKFDEKLLELMDIARDEVKEMVKS